MDNSTLCEFDVNRSQGMAQAAFGMPSRTIQLHMESLEWWGGMRKTVQYLEVHAVVLMALGHL